MFTEDERAKWRQLVARWKAGEKVFDAGKRIEKTDATTVQRQEPVQPIKRNFIAEAQRKHAAEAVGPDTRSSYQRKQSYAAKLYANQQYQKAKDDVKRAEGMKLMMKTISPSTYVEAATGLDLGTAGRLIIDAVAFGLPGAIKSIAGPTMQYGRNFLLSQTMRRGLNKNPILRTYNSSPQYLDTGGNVLDYLDYVKSIFPNSKVKDIVYHSTWAKPFEQFDPSKIKRGYGFYFSPSENHLPFDRMVYSKVDIRNPLEIFPNKNRNLDVSGLWRKELTEKAIKEGLHDGVIGVSNMRNPGEPEIVALNPNQVHILGSRLDRNQFAGFVDNLTVGTQKALYLAPRKTSTPTQISWEDAQKPLSAQLIFPNEAGEGWLKTTADRLGVNINHYYNNIITPEELMQSVKNNGWESFISGKTFTEPAYIPSGFPYGLDKSRILMPYDEIRKMPMMAKYANLPEAEFRKVADDLIGSHEFIHWWNRQLAKNIKSGRMKIPKGYLEYELTWTGENLPDGIDPDALGKKLGYMSEMNGTESNARLGQLFNAFGIKKGELRPQHINLALKFYRKVFPDNQMSIFLNAIKDKNALVKFANENAGTLFGTGTAVTAANKYAE